MEKSAVVAGCNIGGRKRIVLSHAKVGRAVRLVREPGNQHDANAIRVYILVPLLFGLLGRWPRMIGYVKAGTAKSLAKRMDDGQRVRGVIKHWFHFDQRGFVKVTLRLLIDD